MERHYLENLFSPSSIAVIGASDRPKSVGKKVFENILNGGFTGKIYPVNPAHQLIQGYTCFSMLKDIKHPVDLAIISTPAESVPSIIRECGQKGVGTAIVLSSGFSETGKDGKAQEETMLETAKQHRVRIVGPNCLGIMRPFSHLNATFDKNVALSGSIAFVSQSGALSAGILDWSLGKEIGFSALVSLGNCADIGFADIFDYLAYDQHTKSVLLYIEGIKNPRYFMSALRALAYIKPVIVIKAGKNTEGSRAALSHTGVLIGNDKVFDAAIRRAGAVRVEKIEDLFAASEILSTQKKVLGNRLAIVTNGGGAGVIAADRASELNIPLTSLTDAMKNELDKVLPKQWSHQNPLDIIGDATPERYQAVLEICQKSSDIDGILVILVPVAMSNPSKVAKEIIKNAVSNAKLLLACWLGEKQVRHSWKLFSKHNIPCFDTPEKAVEAFSCLAHYYHNQKFLTQIPSVNFKHLQPNIENARHIMEKYLANGRSVLTQYESREILDLFNIPMIPLFEASTAAQSIIMAEKVGFPVVMKIHSEDISHKSSVGGVILNLDSSAAVANAFESLMKKMKSDFPDAHIRGVTIESQYQNTFNREVMVGVARDPVFGPVISFGAGGTLVEIIQDVTLALPPLNDFIARDLLSKARILQPKEKYFHLSDIQRENIIAILLRISDMVCELPYIQEMDINPFILNKNGMLAVDARIVLMKVENKTRYAHLSIPPCDSN